MFRSLVSISSRDVLRTQLEHFVMQEVEACLPSASSNIATGGKAKHPEKSTIITLLQRLATLKRLNRL